jgi:hypothetical protein
VPDVSRNHPLDAAAPSAEVTLEHVARLASIGLGGRGGDP